MKYWRHPGPMRVGANWAVVRVAGIVIFGLIYWFLPLPFSELAPYGSWMFWVSMAFWSGLCVFCIIFITAKQRARKAASENNSKSPDA